MENYKVLGTLFPLILIYSILSPIGSIITIIGFFYKLPPMPYCVNGIVSFIRNVVEKFLKMTLSKKVTRDN